MENVYELNSSNYNCLSSCISKEDVTDLEVEVMIQQSSKNNGMMSNSITNSNQITSSICPESIVPVQTKAYIENGDRGSSDFLKLKQPTNDVEKGKESPVDKQLDLMKRVSLNLSRPI